RRAALAPAGSVVALPPLVHDDVAAALEGERARCGMCQDPPLASDLIMGYSLNHPYVVKVEFPPPPGPDSKDDELKHPFRPPRLPLSPRRSVTTQRTTA